LRVLIVDDERDTVMTLGILLRSEGFDVKLAECGAEVPAMVEQFKPHAVLLDLVMPDRSGLELARELRQRHAGDCPILIAITGRRAADTQELALGCGFQHLVQKPYDPDALLTLVSSLQPPN
jgi:DNA-binding response OmpR family regulator